MALKAVAAPLGSPVGGSGTAGTIPVWSTGTTLGDSQLVQSATAIYTTTRNFGVGATAANWSAAIRVLDMRTSAIWNLNSGSDSVASWTVNALTDTGGNVVYKATAAASQYTQNAGAHVWSRAVSGTAGAGCAFLESARIDSSGRLLVGTATAPSGLSIKLGVYDGSGNAGQQWITEAGGAAFIPAGANALNIYSVSGGPGAEVYTLVGALSNTALNLSVKNDYGVKLNATPGNADAQTLDCYAEGTWTPTLTGFGGTTPTVNTARYVRIGSVVHCTVVLTASPNFSSTYGTTTITAPFSATHNAAVPTNVGAAGISSGQQNAGGTTVYLPTFGTVPAGTISWTFLV